MYTNYPFGLCLAHNGNLTNVKDLRETVFAEGRHINTDSVRRLEWRELIYKSDTILEKELVR